MARKVQRWAPRVGVEPSGIEVCDLGFRWGSCGKGGTLHFHWAAILLPAGIVEYIVVHELAHLVERNHTPDFRLKLERTLPDFGARKVWLAGQGGGFLGL